MTKVTISEASLRSLATLNKLNKLFADAVAGHFDYFSAEVQRQVARDHSVTKLFLASIDPRRVILTATQDGRIIGYAIGAAPAVGSAQLFWLYVDPKFRGANTGLSLLSRMLKALAARGARQISIATHDHRKYYERQGFKFVEHKQAHGVDMDVLVFNLPDALAGAPVSPHRRIPWPHFRYKLILKWVLLFLVLEIAAVWLSQYQVVKQMVHVSPTPTVKPAPAPPRPGDLIAQDSTEHFTPEQAAALISHNYPGTTAKLGLGLTKIIFHYRSQLPDGQIITVYGRAYLPDVPRNNLPTFAFAPGTTGIGDQCAPSLEKPAVANWANYDSHMSAYAAQGYAAVTTDYEGMRDPGRLHHYMVGELEGRALLDAVRALRHLPQAKGRLATGNVFFAGYSQGGHAAFWADKIALSYAPDVTPLGVIGFGPVMSVKATLADITRGANINWFGPNVILSYQDYYGVSYPGIIQPAREATLAADVLAHCIDTDLAYWGHTPATIYTPEFIQAAQTNTINTAFPQFAAALDVNEVGADPTITAKRINEGAQDNVVLPSQQLAAVPQLCASSRGPVQYLAYPNSTHYTTMLHSFNDTLAWMHSLMNRGTVPSTCS